MGSSSILDLILSGRQSLDKLFRQSAQPFICDELAEGVLRFEPMDVDARALDVVISCGVHGNETAPVEVVDRLLQRIMAGDLKINARVLIVFANLQALRQGVRYVEEDMNRLFGGKLDAKDSSEQRRATVLELCMMRFFSRSVRLDVPRFHYDLHTSIHGSLIEKFAIYPVPVFGQKFEKKEIARLALTGVKTVLLQSSEAPTFSFFGSRYCNAHAFTIELGSAKPLGQNQDIDLSELEHFLSQLIEGVLPQADAIADDMQVFRVSREVIKKSEQFQMFLPETVDNFVPLVQGFCIASDENGPNIITEENARLVFPGPNVPIGQRAGLIVVPVTDFS